LTPVLVGYPPPAWLRLLFRSPIPRSWIAIIARPRTPETAWRVCFAPQALRDDPNLPEKMKRSIEQLQLRVRSDPAP